MRFFLIAFAFCCVVPDLYAGRGDLAGTAAGSELLIPIGARSIALGGSSLSTVDGLEAIYWNPSGLAYSSSNVDLMASHMSYLADIGVDYAAVGTGMGDLGRVAISAKTLSFGQIPITTEDQPDGTGQYASPSYSVIGATVARAITDHIAFGINVNYVVETMEDVSATGFAFTAGLQYHGLGGIDALSLGVVVRNIGSPLQYSGDALIQNAVIDNTQRGSSQVAVIASSDDLPSTIEIGMGYKLPVADKSSISFTATYVNNNYSDDEYAFGAEYNYSDLIYLRGGFNFLSQEEPTTNVFGPAGGFGINTTVGGAKVNFDYTYRSAQLFSGNHIFAIQIGF
jgi:hypothetical protein